MADVFVKITERADGTCEVMDLESREVLRVCEDLEEATLYVLESHMELSVILSQPKYDPLVVFGDYS